MYMVWSQSMYSVRMLYSAWNYTPLLVETGEVSASDRSDQFLYHYLTDTYVVIVTCQQRIKELGPCLYMSSPIHEHRSTLLLSLPLLQVKLLNFCFSFLYFIALKTVVGRLITQSIIILLYFIIIMDFYYDYSNWINVPSNFRVPNYLPVGWTPVSLHIPSPNQQILIY